MPLLEQGEQFIPTKTYRFIRLENKFGFEEICSNDRRQHKDLAMTTNLFNGITPDNKPIVTDGGKLIAFEDHVELTIEWTASTQIKAMIGFDYYQKNASEAWDQIQLGVHKETAQILAEFLHKPVVMKYQPTAGLHAPVQEFTCIPR